MSALNAHILFMIFISALSVHILRLCAFIFCDYARPERSYLVYAVHECSCIVFMSALSIHILFVVFMNALSARNLCSWALMSCVYERPERSYFVYDVYQRPERSHLVCMSAHILCS